MLSPEKSEALMGICREPSELRHAGGHEIPTSREHQATILNFLRGNVCSNSKNKESL